MQNIVRQLRIDQGWTQAALAERLRVSRQTINALEAQRYQPTLSLALSIGRLFQRPVESIFVADDDETAAPARRADQAPADSDGYHARQSLGYMLNRAADIVATVVSQILREASMSLPEWRVLTVLTDHAEQSLSELAAHAGTELSYLSRIVAKAEEDGLVTRRPSAQDRRVTAVAITAAGLARVRELAPRIKKIDNGWFDSISPADVEALRRTLPVIYANALKSELAEGGSTRKLTVPRRMGVAAARSVKLPGSRQPE